VRSSTSNSKWTVLNRRWALLGLMAFVLVFLVLASVGRYAAVRLSSDHAWSGGDPCMNSRDGLIVNEAETDHWDIYDALYYGFGDAIPNARKADVLFLGNSRMLFAFRESAVSPISEETGLRFFNLCFPANDGMVMAHQTILRHDLKPSIVVVNDSSFFSALWSPYAKSTADAGVWGAWMRVTEHRLSWSLRVRFHRWFPFFNFGHLRKAVPPITCQSPEDGCLVAENVSRGEDPVDIRLVTKEDVVPPEKARVARWFVREMAKRGCAVVLTNIPYDVMTYARMRKQGSAMGALLSAPENLVAFRRSEKLAEELGIPLVSVSERGLQTFDGSHLTEESARRFSRDFFKQFLKLTCVKNLLKRPAGH